jgi:hypothetical protein
MKSSSISKSGRVALSCTIRRIEQVPTFAPCGKSLIPSKVKMTTKGDQILNSPLSKIGGKGLFIKELEVGLLEGKADIAVLTCSACQSARGLLRVAILIVCCIKLI